MTEAVDDAEEVPPQDEPVEDEQPAEEDTSAEDERPSLTELVARLSRELSVLVFLEAQIAMKRNMPEVRRVARDLVGALVVAVAFITVFVFANVAAFIGLETVVSGWVAALVLGGLWLVVGAVLALALMIRAEHVTGWKWWQVFTGGEEDDTAELEAARAEAEHAVRATIEELAPVLTVEIATASAGGMAGGIVGVGGDLLEASDDLVEDIVDELPGGGVVNQIWDVVLTPGRYGVRVATTVLKRG